MFDNAAIHVLQENDDAEHHGHGAHDGGANKHGFGGGFEGVAAAVGFFEEQFGVFKVGIETEFLDDIVLDAFEGFNLAELVNGLGVVSNRPVAVHRNGDGTH